MDQCLCDICISKKIINGTFDLSIISNFVEEIQEYLLKKFEQLYFEYERYIKSRNGGKFNVNEYYSMFKYPFNKYTNPDIYKQIMVHIAMKKYEHLDYFFYYKKCFHCLDEFCYKKHQLKIYENYIEEHLFKGCCSNECMQCISRNNCDDKRLCIILGKGETQYICSGKRCNNLFEYDKRYTDIIEIETKDEEWEPDLYNEGIFCSWDCWDNMHS